jgi:hypothetical protein
MRGPLSRIFPSNQLRGRSAVNRSMKGYQSSMLTRTYTPKLKLELNASILMVYILKFHTSLGQLLSISSVSSSRYSISAPVGMGS